MKNGLKVFCSLVFIFTAGMGTSVADGHFDNAIKARKAVMALYAWNLGQLGAMAKGDIEYNAEAAQIAAENIKIMATMNMGSAWPQGSDSTALPGKTRAKVEAWSTYPESAEINKKLAAAAVAMSDVAGDGVDAVRANIGAIGGACKDCHTKFREAE